MNDLAFLAAIRDEPDDDTARLIYADWLYDHDQADRAEFIRVQVELSQGVRDRGKAVELLRRLRTLSVQHRRQWLGALKNWAPDSYFERGFVSQISLSARDFLDHAAEILTDHPITRLHLHGVADHIAELASCVHLAGMTALDLHSNLLSDQAILLLAGSPHLSRLRSLDLRLTRLSAVGLQAVIQSPHLGALTTLNVADNRFRDAGIVALTTAPMLPPLQRLDLSWNNLGSVSAQHLASCARLESLRVLRLAHNHLTHLDVARLTQSSHLQHLQMLDVSANDIRREEVVELRAMFGKRVVF